LGNLELIYRYAAFAAVATVSNLAAQRAVLSFARADTGLTLAIAVGTLVGLIIKYVLDKRWIFFDTTHGAATHARTFALYSAMGIATTLIFWLSEAVFWMIWKNHTMREVGAILGLTVGYFIKFNLDRRYVFQREQRDQGQQ
jgi:putative flippase GtrA